MINLCDLSGKVIKCWTKDSGIIQQEIEISDLCDGIYFLTITGKDSNHSQKLIIQN
jgi:hypothetical protein